MCSHSENYLIQLQLVIQSLKKEYKIIDTALNISCENTCTYMGYYQEETIPMKRRFIDQAKEICEKEE